MKPFFIITGDEKININGTQKIMQWTKDNKINFDQCSEPHQIIL